MIELGLATAIARKNDMFCRVSASGYRLVFYTGTESEPGTWMECGSTVIDGANGNVRVSRNAVESICQ